MDDSFLLIFDLSDHVQSTEVVSDPIEVVPGSDQVTDSGEVSPDSLASGADDAAIVVENTEAIVEDPGQPITPDYTAAFAVVLCIGIVFGLMVWNTLSKRWNA